MKRILIIAISLLLVAIGRAETWNPETLPMVHLQDSTRWTCNPDDILFPSTVETLDSICTALEHAKGVQCVVVCVEHIEGDDPYVFNKDLFEKYGFGQSGADNGLIITLATLDRSYFISPGRGLEGTLPDAICNRIENAIMVPYLKESDWNSALTGTLLAISQYIQGDDTLLKQAEEDQDGGGVAGVLLALLGVGGLIGGASYSDYRARNRKCPHCGAKHTLRMTSEKISEASHYRYYHQVWTCKDCGYQEPKTKTVDYLSSAAGGAAAGTTFGHSSRRSSGGGFRGGSFGGGRYGGGGAGGRF